MGEVSRIGWTKATWNPWHGCRKISPGCKFCYMFREKRMYGQEPTNVVRSKTTFNAPLKWKDPSVVFTCSWSDWLIEEADAPGWRDAAHDIILRTPHIYQILTKRIDRAPGRIPRSVMDCERAWFGVSVEDRKHGVPRIAQLREHIDSPRRFLSIEPLLEDVGTLDLDGIAWGIVGGESGGERREMEIQWLADVVQQFVARKIPVYTKQDSGVKSGLQGRIPNHFWLHQMPPAMAALMGGAA